jgi:hypothetical protein
MVMAYAWKGKPGSSAALHPAFQVHSQEAEVPDMEQPASAQKIF